MKNKVTYKMLPESRSITMNTDGSIIGTLKKTTVYYIWKIPIWYTNRYISGTKKQLTSIIDNPFK